MCVFVCVCARARVRACVSTAITNTHTDANTFAPPCLSTAMNCTSRQPLSLTRQRTVFKLRTIFSSYLAKNEVREHYKDNVFRNNQYSVWDPVRIYKKRLMFCVTMWSVLSPQASNVSSNVRESSLMLRPTCNIQFNVTANMPNDLSFN